MIEIFKTDVRETHHVTMLTGVLLEHFPGTRISFDTDDCDKVLRLEGRTLVPATIVEVLGAHGFQCTALE